MSTTISDYIESDLAIRIGASAGSAIHLTLHALSSHYGVSPTPVRLLVPRAMSEKLSAKVVYPGPVMAPVEAGKPLGTLKVSRGENVVLEVPLQAGESVGTGSLHQRAFDAMGEMVINVFRSGMDRL